MLRAFGHRVAIVWLGLFSKNQASFTRTRFSIETVSWPETASKTIRFQRVYTEPIQPLNTTVYVKAISFSGPCASSIGSKFDQTGVRRLSSPRPNPESSFSLSLRYSAGAYRRKSQHFETSLPVAAVWPSVYSKIHESCKSEVKSQIKVVIVQQSAALRARLTIFTLLASQFRARPFLNRCGFAVYTTNETVSFWKRSTFESVFKTTRFWQRTRPAPCKRKA